MDSSGSTGQGKSKRVPVGHLDEYPDNPRRRNVDVLRESLRINGQYRPLVVQASTMTVLAGNHTLQAARAEGWKSVDCWIVDVDDTQAKRIVLADNRTADIGGYDDTALADLLRDIDGLAGTGYDQDALDDLLASLGQIEETMPESFTGDYAETQAETETRRNTGIPRVSQGYREVILVLKVDQLQMFNERIDELKKAWGTESTSDTVLEAVQRCS